MIRVLFALLLLFPITAHAQECGNIPVAEAPSAGEAEGHCGSIYSRQFEYRASRLDLRRDIDRRRADFIAPALKNYEFYEADVKALNAARSHQNDVTSR